MQLAKNQIKRLAKLYAATLIRTTDCWSIKELDDEEQNFFKLELDKVAEKIHWKKCKTFKECYVAIVNDNFNLLKSYTRRR